MKRKIILFSIFGLIVVLTMFFLIVYVNGSSPIKYNNTNDNLSNWMKNVDDETKVNDLVIPGSHDAGTNVMSFFCETQTFTVKEQLMVGVRYFDIRVNNDNNILKIFHNIESGTEFIPILKDIKEFLDNEKTEGLILDFQHFKNNSETMVIEALNTYLNGYMVSTTLNELEFVSGLKIKDLRGKCIVLFGDNQSIADKYDYIFARNNDGCTKKNQALDSYYIKKYNVMSSSSYIEKGIPFYISKIKEKISTEGNKGLFVLQCQLTDGALIFGPYSREKTHDENMSRYIKNLKSSEDLSIINILMRDFMTQKKVEEIITLNYYKNSVLMKANTKNLFEK